jgi:hypothetical protein
MVYMGVSLAITVAGLLVAYQLYNVEINPDKTLNAVLFEKMTGRLGPPPGALRHRHPVLGGGAPHHRRADRLPRRPPGPREHGARPLVPARFANLSERLVTRTASCSWASSGFVMMLATRGSVDLLVIFYSINVFITFSLSQLGMVRHWWQERATDPAGCTSSRSTASASC